VQKRTKLTLGALLLCLALTGPAAAQSSRDDLAPMGCFLASGLQAPGVVSHVLSAHALNQQLDAFAGDVTQDTLAKAAIAAHITETAFYGAQAGVWIVRAGLILDRQPVRRSTLLLSAGMLDAAMGAAGAIVGAVLFASRDAMSIGGAPGDLLATSATIHLGFGLGSLVAGLFEIMAGALMREEEPRSTVMLAPSPGGLSVVGRW